MSTQFELLKEQRFKPFFLTQLLGALNDNLFKTALITLVAFHSQSLTQLDSQFLATLLPGLFILPFFLFSATAGQIADKYEKSRVIRWVKLFEIGIMLLASVGLFFSQFWLLVMALVMMGMHSTLFGPVKYGYLPQHLRPHELVGGNGMVEMGSFVAILLGQILGAWLASQSQYAVMTSVAVLVIAVLGYRSCLGIPNTPASAPALVINWNPVTETWANVKHIWQTQSTWVAIVAISWFWFYGATLLAQFPNFTTRVLHGNESVFISLLCVFSIGIGVGSLLCEKLSRGKVELGLVMLGGIGMTLFGADIGCSVLNLEPVNNLTATMLWQTPHYWHLLIAILCTGIFGGFFIVPLYVQIQTTGDTAFQSRIIASNNIMNALFMVVSALYALWLIQLGLSIPQLFIITAALNALVMVYLCWRQIHYWHTFKECCQRLI